MMTFDKIKALDLGIKIKKGNIPSHLCKYQSIDHFSLQGLANNTLWFSKLESFNDPFEGKISFSKELKEHTLQTINVDVSQFNIDAITQIAEDGLKKLRDSPSVCCFSRSDDDILLWSHYANGHAGICLKFDLTKDLDFFSPIFPISYESEMAPSDTMKDFTLHFFQRKYEAWTYEKEYRVVSYLEPGSKHYNPKALAEVIFGCRTDISDKLLVRSILGKDVIYKQCQLNKEEFKLDIVNSIF